MGQVNPVRNSSGALNPAGIIIKPNPAAEQRGIISNGVKRVVNVPVSTKLRCFSPTPSPGGRGELEVSHDKRGIAGSGDR